MTTPSTGTYLWEATQQTPMITGTILLVGLPTALDTRYVNEADYRTFLSTRLSFTPTGTINTTLLTGTYNIQWALGDGVDVIITGSTTQGFPWLEVPAASVIESWACTADVTGSITVNILKSTYANFPPASPVAGLGQPILSSKRTNTGNATGTVTLAMNDYLQAQVVSVATVKMVNVSLRLRRT
jgi:hypothetical protein